MKLLLNLFLTLLCSSSVLAGFFILVAKKKIKTGGPISVYTALIFIPWFIAIIPIVMIINLFSPLYFGRYAFPIIMFSVIMLIIFIFVLVKSNIYPHSYLEKKVLSNSRFLQVDYGKRLLKYSLFINLFYIAPFIIASIYIIIRYNQTVFDYIKTYYFSDPYLTAVVLLTPFGMLINGPVILIGILIGVMIFSLAVMLLFSLTFSINGTIRTFKGSNKLTGVAALYIILLLIPIANIICMIYLCIKARKEIKDNMSSQGQKSEFLEKA